MRALYLDCFSGISGDMTVGALCDLGVSPSQFEWELGRLNLGDYHTHFERVRRQHIEGVQFFIHAAGTPCHHPAATAPHHHAHNHPASGHPQGRSHADIRALIAASSLAENVKTRALSIFRRIAEAEAKIHGEPVETVHFHEVGALDSIADIVCVCAGIAALGVEQVFVSHLVEGRGFIETAHGQMPVPAPATLEILRGIPLGQVDEPHELITPTGAAIVAEFGTSFGVMPPLKIERIGYGIGTRQLPHRPNVLRAVLGELAGPDAGGFDTDIVTRIEANLDDVSPEILATLMHKLPAIGALDVFFTPVQMKKNRPASLLTVLCDPADAPRLARVILTETTSFGVRLDDLRRFKLARRQETVHTPYGELTVKLGLLDGAIVQTAPEFEACRNAAEKHDVPLRLVYEAAIQAAREAGFAPLLR